MLGINKDPELLLPPQYLKLALEEIRTKRLKGKYIRATSLNQLEAQPALDALLSEPVNLHLV